MKIFVDTNILLDVALAHDRAAFYNDANAIFDWSARNPGRAFVAWHSLSNISFIFRRAYVRRFAGQLGEEAAGRQGREGAHEFVERIVDIFEVAGTASASAKLSLRFSMTDFEDALQLAAAVFAGADVIVTRDPRHFNDSIIPAQRPRSFLDAQQVRDEEEI